MKTNFETDGCLKLVQDPLEPLSLLGSSSFPRFSVGLEFEFPDDRLLRPGSPLRRFYNENAFVRKRGTAWLIFGNWTRHPQEFPSWSKQEASTLDGNKSRCFRERFIPPYFIESSHCWFPNIAWYCELRLWTFLTLQKNMPTHFNLRAGYGRISSCIIYKH